MDFTIKLLLPSAVGSAAREAQSAGGSLSPVHVERDGAWAWGLAGTPLRPVFLLSKKAFLTFSGQREPDIHSPPQQLHIQIPYYETHQKSCAVVISDKSFSDKNGLL